MAVIADDVGQHLRPDDLEQRLAPILEVVGHDLHDRVPSQAGLEDGDGHRRRPAPPVDRGLPVAEAQAGLPSPLGRHDRDVPAASADLVVDPGEMVGVALGCLVRAMDEEEDAAGRGGCRRHGLTLHAGGGCGPGR